MNEEELKKDITAGCFPTAMIEYADGVVLLHNTQNLAWLKANASYGGVKTGELEVESEEGGKFKYKYKPTVGKEIEIEVE